MSASARRAGGLSYGVPGKPGTSYELIAMVLTVNFMKFHDFLSFWAPDLNKYKIDTFWATRSNIRLYTDTNLRSGFSVIESYFPISLHAPSMFSQRLL